VTSAVYRSGSTFGEARSVVSRSQAVVLLQLFALTVMLIPSDAVIKAIGAGGYAAALVGMFAFAAYLAAIMLGLHSLSEHRNPIRIVLCLLWLSVLASYVLMNRSILTVPELASADRQLMQLAVISGAALVAAEWVNSLSDIRRVLRALCWGGAFAGVVATLQFWLNLDLAVYLRDLPGFSLNYDNAGILVRDGINRVSGTAIYPIELGVVAGMLLPLAVYLAVYDVERSARRRWATVGLIALAIPTSVSRSAIISVGLALAVLVVLMPVRQRLVALFTVPLGLVAVFMSAPGVIGTLTSFFTAGTSDPSVATRVTDYPLVEAFVQKAPFFGRGGGTYIADNAIDILDNQFLKTAIELGLVGVVALTIFFVVPVIVALSARRRSSDPELRLLCAALAGAALAGTACSFTFDSLSFPMFANVEALVVGLIGAAWRLAVTARSSTTTPPDAGSAFAAPAAGTRALLSTGGSSWIC
jgi:O-antigen ligase